MKNEKPTIPLWVYTGIIAILAAQVVFTTQPEWWLKLVCLEMIVGFYILSRKIFWRK